MNTISKQIHLFIAGDSTVATNTEATYPQAGWGQVIGEQLSPTIQVRNYALNGRSTKSFINEGHLEKIKNEIQQGDILMIQFGHNDEKKEDPSRYTDPYTDYKTNLKQYIDVAKEKGALPILITPVNRRSFNEYGAVINTHEPYSLAMIKVAHETQTHLIDLCQKSKILFEKYGDEKSKQLFMIFKPNQYSNYPEGKEDNTHFNIDGARQIARLVIEGIIENKIEPLYRNLR